MAHVIVWDLEAILDLEGFAAANGLEKKTDEEIRDELGDKFPTTSITRSPYPAISESSKSIFDRRAASHNLFRIGLVFW